MIRAVLLACTVGSSAAAQSVMPCDWQARADAIVEPWADHTRTFASGAVRLALLDAAEPALGAFYLLVLSPPYDALGLRQCRVVGLSEGFGFTTLDFASLTAEYDPARGLVFQLAARIADPALDVTNAADLQVILNQTSGDLSATLEVGAE